MPPKKKVPARRASTGKNIPTTPSGRPKREAAVDVGFTYKLTASRAPNGSTSTLAKNSKDAAAPKSVKAVAETPKKRGRPAKAVATPVTASPKKAAAAKATTAPAVKAGRGRPRRVDAPAAPTATTTATKRKRTQEEPEAAPAKKRGRPAKSATAATATSTAKTRIPLVKKVTADEPTKANGKTATKPAAKRGRPAGSKNIVKSPATTKFAAKKGAKPKKQAVKSESEDFPEGLTQTMDLDADVGDTQYWLMKAEPDTRIEKERDVSFSIDTLADATEPEPWDGVRNYVARNNMRAMRKGDLAFFYHSNCAVPGIVGVMRIAEEHDIDESAFDPQHPYFDEKSSKDKPKWDCVKVEFVKKFSDIITLKELKSTPELANMQIAQKAYGRLSVQYVTPDQWKFVLKMANEPENLGETSGVSGYEADTNGETDREAVDESVGVDDGETDVEAKLAAYGSDDDIIDEGGPAANFINTIPETNGHVIPEIGPGDANRMDGLDKDDSMVSAEEN